jgi:hypothetical protein
MTQTATKIGTIANLRIRARVDHDCPHCHVLATQPCQSDTSAAESVIVHDARLDLAYDAAGERHILWGIQQGRKQALDEMCEALNMLSK